MKLGIIVQARTGSTRLPNKVLQDFYQGKSILFILLERLKEIGIPITVATSSTIQDDAIEELAKELQLAYFRGDEQNVLSRFTEVADIYQYTHLIRVCADNPFLSLILLNKLLEAVQENLDYISFAHQETPAMLTHFGVFAEIVKTSALKQVPDDKFYQEHVTNYVYQHPKKFKLKWLATNEDLFFSNIIRLTVDTLEDFKTAQSIYAAFMQQSPNFDIVELFDYLRENKHLLEGMQRSIEENKK